jgi:hypothetical protein
VKDERFNELLNGPLAHPMPMFAISRLALALRDVVGATGEAGEKALECHCADRELSDLRAGGCCNCGQSDTCDCRCHELARAAGA